ncbi:MFS transporter [Actinopolyspora mortivallis]|uniref:MFS transporter n=1 Tax=Actinopolyspora mortivallis TaxID=33906 RepID=A0A2T0GX26_ACTMO|nr:MFS transporter [Actinopolyspora mortivallis]PRW63668.1 MFS transporter [Actinopolyspora mortivallis]
MSTTTEPNTAPKPPPSRNILLDSGFLRLWGGSTASATATWALPFLLGLAVLQNTLTPTEVGLLLATRTTGFLVAVPVGGLLTDRYAARRVILLSGTLAAAATPVLAWGMGHSLMLAAGAAALVGIGQGTTRPAYQALTAEVVDPDRLQQANAARTFSVRVTTFVAPAGTALLATTLGLRTLLLLTAALWLVSALCPPSGTHRGHDEEAETPGLLSGFVAGLREARRHSWFPAGLVALSTVITFGYSATNIVLPLISRDRYGSEFVLAGALTAYTAGALLGAVLIGRWRPRSPGWTALVALGCYGIAPLTLLLPVPPYVVFAGYVVAGVGIELFNVPWFTATQREVDPRLLGRVSSLDFLVSYGLAPLGLALIGPAVEAFGPGWVLGACSLLCFTVPTLLTLVPGTRHFAHPRR